MTAAYAVVVALGAAVCAGLMLAEPPRPKLPKRTKPPRHKPRHRLPYRTEIAAMFREILYTTGVVATAVIIVAVAALPFIVKGLHWLDARRMRRFWDGQAVHS